MSVGVSIWGSQREKESVCTRERKGATERMKRRPRGERQGKVDEKMRENICRRYFY